MNPILEMVIDHKGGHYCHALEVYDVYELKSCIDALYDDLIYDYSIEDFIDFIESMELYCTNDENEAEVWEFNIEEYILTL